MTDECDRNEPHRQLGAKFIVTAGIDSKKPGTDLCGLQQNSQYLLLQCKMANKVNEDDEEEMFVQLWSPYGAG